MTLRSWSSALADHRVKFLVSASPNVVEPTIDTIDDSEVDDETDDKEVCWWKGGRRATDSLGFSFFSHDHDSLLIMLLTRAGCWL